MVISEGSISQEFCRVDGMQNIFPSPYRVLDLKGVCVDLDLNPRTSRFTQNFLVQFSSRSTLLLQVHAGTQGITFLLSHWKLLYIFKNYCYTNYLLCNNFLS